MASTCANARAVAIAAAAWLATMRSTSTAAGVIGARTNTPSTPSSSPRDDSGRPANAAMPCARTQSGRRILASCAASVTTTGARDAATAPTLNAPTGMRWKSPLSRVAVTLPLSRSRAALATRCRHDVLSAQAGAFAHARAAIALVEQPQARERDVFVFGQPARDQRQQVVQRSLLRQLEQQLLELIRGRRQ